MPSLKNFKTKFTSKSKKKKAAERELSKTMPAPALSQTPPVRRRNEKTLPGSFAVRTSAPATLGAAGPSTSAAGPSTSAAGPSPSAARHSTSMRSLISSRSPSSSRLQIDEHNQLKELDRPDEPQNSSDPDTSLLDYDDKREITSNLVRTSSFPEGDGDDEKLGSRPTLHHSPRTIHHSPGTKSQPGSLRDSFNTSIISMEEEDVKRRQSVTEAEVCLGEVIGTLEILTSTKDEETPGLDYYTELENVAAATLRRQEELISKLRSRIAHLEDTLAEFQKYKDSTENEISALNDSLKAQNKNLENLVYKLNKEVSYCQTHHQLVKNPNGNRISGLPEDAPTPAWMVDFKYLSPLIKSLEDQVSMKTQELGSLKRKFAKYEADIRSLTAENDNLRRAMKSGGDDPEAIGKKTWDQLQKQALLVVEENEILLRELDLQQEKTSQVHEEHYYELTQLEDKVKKVEAERQVVLERLTDTKCQLEMSKSKCEQLTSSMALKIDRDEHNRVVVEFKSKLESAKEEQHRTKESFLAKLCEMNYEKEKCEMVTDELSDELREAKQELRRKEKCMSSLEEDCAALTREVKKGKDIVAKLLLVTDEAVHERQSMKDFLKSENKEKQKSVGAIIESELVKEKLVESFKRYKIKAEQQMDKLMSKVEKQAEGFDVERREYERQIKHLRLMVHEKDVETQAASRDKQDVEQCLEMVWKATQSDNHDLNNSLRKSMGESRCRHLGKFWMNDCKTDVLRQSDE